MEPNTANKAAAEVIAEVKAEVKAEVTAAGDPHHSSLYRYERKFFEDELDRHEVASLVRLHPALFRRAYAPRQVNNLYLDSADDRCYFDNVEGIRERLKVRIRWYGSLFGSISKPVLELKIKRGLVGRKESFPLPPFDLGPGLRREDVHRLFDQAELPPERRLTLAALRPALLNRYLRQYFLSADGRVRLTLDNDLEFHVAQPHRSTFLAQHKDRFSTILELKYGQEDSHLADRIAPLFPFRMTRSSKYVSGRDLLDIW